MYDHPPDDRQATHTTGLTKLNFPLCQLISCLRGNQIMGPKLKYRLFIVCSVIAPCDGIFLELTSASDNSAPALGSRNDPAEEAPDIDAQLGWEETVRFKTVGFWNVIGNCGIPSRRQSPEILTTHGALALLTRTSLHLMWNCRNSGRN